MSKLEQLIYELCPDGVEYKKIKDVFQRLKGTPITARKMKEIQTDDGEIRVFAGGKTVINAKEKDIPNAIITRVPAVLVQSRGVIDVVYFENPFTFKNEMWAYTTREKITVKYLYYVLKNSVQHFRDSASSMGSLPQISLPVTEEFIIPIPPLSVQKEIVRILDDFTECTEEIIAKLTAEQLARKQQYEYYRDELFGKDYAGMLNRCFENNIEVTTLENIGKFTRGKRFVRSDITDKGTPCIHYGDLYTYYGVSAEKTKCFLDEDFSKKMRFAHKGDVVIVQAGENDMDIGIGVAWMGDEDVAVHDACYIFQHNINPKYISHYLRTSIYHLQIKKYVSTGKICSISAKYIGKAKIPVPSLSEQQRIVDILDHFDVIYNDISISLSAEKKARQQQYEYYRDKLLTFKEKEVSKDE